MLVTVQVTESVLVVMVRDIINDWYEYKKKIVKLLKSLLVVVYYLDPFDIKEQW